MTESEDARVTGMALVRLDQVVNDTVAEVNAALPDVPTVEILANIHNLLSQYLGRLERMLIDLGLPDSPKMIAALRNAGIKAGFDTKRTAD